MHSVFPNYFNGNYISKGQNNYNPASFFSSVSFGFSLPCWGYHSGLIHKDNLAMFFYAGFPSWSIPLKSDLILRAFSHLKVCTKVCPKNSQIVTQFLSGSVTCGFALQILKSTLSDFPRGCVYCCYDGGSCASCRRLLLWGMCCVSAQLP